MLSGIALQFLRQMVRAQDIAWLLLFGALHAVSPARNPAELQLLIALAAFQVISPRIHWFSTTAGNTVSIAIKLFLGWLLIGVTFGLESSYYLILVLPVVSAATTLSGWGAFITTIIACGAYLSFLLFLDWNRYVIPPDQIEEISLRVIFLLLVGYLTYELTRENRIAAKKYQAAATDLAEANRHLQDAEEHIRRADRLAALGQLTAGLAHELRNPLGTIRSSAEVLQKKLADGDPVVQELTSYITTEVERTDMLITRFLQFARPFRLQLAPSSIVPVIDRAIEQWKHRFPASGITVLRNDLPHLHPVQIDQEMMEQVILNLLINAVEASPEQGVVTIKTRETEQSVEVSVIDRGTGIGHEHRESIFNPFYTTKPNGVGLGLAIVSKIVDEHGGHIFVESNPGEGTVFRVWLPIAS